MCPLCVTVFAVASLVMARTRRRTRHADPAQWRLRATDVTYPEKPQ